MARKVCVMTSAHPAFDVRIFHKECKSLARAGYQVTLIASSAEQGAFDGIDLKPLPKWKNRWDRMTRGPFVVYRKAREENADVYHFHDPELIPAALLLRRAGKRVIYDIHEDLPRTVSYKPYIPGFLKSLVSRAVERIENWAGARFSALIAANPTIAAATQFKVINFRRSKRFGSSPTPARTVATITSQRLLKASATSGWSGPRTFSQIRNAR